MEQLIVLPWGQEDLRKTPEQQAAYRREWRRTQAWKRQTSDSVFLRECACHPPEVAEQISLLGNAMKELERQKRFRELPSGTQLELFPTEAEKKAVEEQIKHWQIYGSPDIGWWDIEKAS